MIKSVFIVKGILFSSLLFAQSKIITLSPKGGISGEVNIEKWDDRILINAPFSQIPILKIKDNCDYSRYPGKSATCIKINNKQVWDRLLSQGEVTFNADGSAIWRYQAGIGKVDRNAVNTDKFILKTQYDALPTGRKWKCIYIQNGTYCLRYPGNPPLTYQLPTPLGRKLESIECEIQAASFHPEDQLIIKLTADPDGKKVIAEKKLEKKDTSKPITFSGNLDEVKYISLEGVTSKKGGLIFPSRWVIKAKYSLASSIPLSLAKGENTVKFSSSNTGSPGLIISCTVQDAPYIEDFEADKWGKAPYLTSDNDSWQGANYLSMTMPGALELRPTDEQKYFDLSGFDRIRVALRCKSGKNAFIYMYIYYDDPETGKSKNSGFRRLITTHNIKQWTLVYANIANLSDEAKKRITKIKINSVGDWYRGKQTVEIDALELLKAKPIASVPDDEQEFRMKFKEVALAKLAKAKRIKFEVPQNIPDIKKGIYFGAMLGAPSRIKEWAGLSEMDAWRVTFQDQLDLGFNAVLLSNYIGPGRKKFDQVLDVAESMGVRLWYQGPHFWRYKGSQERSIAYYKRNVKPHIEKELPKYANRWGILAWEPSEEEPPTFVDAVKPQYELMRKVDPHHPPVIIWNATASLWRMAKIIKPRVQSFDIYPYFGGYTAELEYGYMRGLLKNLTDAARSGNSVAWVVMQSYAHRSQDGDSVFWDRRPQTPADVKLQMWLAATLGCRGFFFYPYNQTRHSLQFTKELAGGTTNTSQTTFCQLAPPFFKETTFRNAIRETVRKFKKLEPFLVKGEFIKEVSETGNKRLYACHYQFRGVDCLRIANSDRRQAQALTINLLPGIKSPWYRDLLTGKITQNLSDFGPIQPGEGLMIAVAANMKKLALTK